LGLVGGGGGWMKNFIGMILNFMILIEELSGIPGFPKQNFLVS